MESVVSGHLVPPTATPTTVTVTQASTATPNAFTDPRNAGDLHKIATIMPAFLIGFVVFLALFLACGMYHARRRRRMRLLFAGVDVVPAVEEPRERRQKRRKKRLSKPKLYEVDLKGAGWDTDLEALLPVAAELQHEPRLSSPPPSPGANSKAPGALWFVPRVLRSKPADAPQPPPLRPSSPRPPVQQAQVAFIVSMPAPRRAHGHAAHEIVLGTTRLPYRGDPDDSADDADILPREKGIAWIEPTLGQLG